MCRISLDPSPLLVSGCKQKKNQCMLMLGFSSIQSQKCSNNAKLLLSVQAAVATRQSNAKISRQLVSVLFSGDRIRTLKGSCFSLVY